MASVLQEIQRFGSIFYIVCHWWDLAMFALGLTSKRSGLCQVCGWAQAGSFLALQRGLTISRFVTWALWWKIFLWHFCTGHHLKDQKCVLFLPLYPWFASFNSLYAKFHCFLSNRGFLNHRIVPGVPAWIVIVHALVEKHEHSTDLQ